MQRFDYIIIGAGILGLATARALLKRAPDSSILVLEKEEAPARHQTGRNSGVIHSGIYYKPGSLKSNICKAGKRKLELFCDEHAIKYEICGKVIVATDPSEDERFENLLRRGKENGVECRDIGREELNELEPHVAGHKAIYVPEAGIVNYSEVSNVLCQELIASGGVVRFSEKVTSILNTEAEIVVSTEGNDYSGSYLVNCAGLYSDIVAEFEGQELEHRIIPFRGEYFDLTPEAISLCKNLIYPVPDPRFPFLGVHFTRRVNGTVDCGPNAVFAFGRENYSKTDINLAESFNAMSYLGFLKFAKEHWKTGLGELKRSISKRSFVSALKRLVPEIEERHLAPAPAGIRAQALGSGGTLIDDFLFRKSKRCVHVCNAPSPGATSSLEIAEYVVNELEELQ